MKLFTRSLGTLSAAVLLATTANATTVLSSLYTSNVVSNSTTNFTASLALPQFDASLGTLQAVYLTLYGNVVGTIKFESLDAQATTITSQLGASITLTRPDNSTLVVTLPVYSASTAVSAFDGTIDFGGTSGATLTGVSASSSNAATLTSPSDLALFTGLGNVTAGFAANGNSTASGSGNLITQFQTTAGGYATVQYAYDNGSAVPEPASWALMAGGFGLLGGALRRKRPTTSVRFG